MRVTMSAPFAIKKGVKQIFGEVGSGNMMSVLQIIFPPLHFNSCREGARKCGM
jgi:hypothetical protein